MIWSLRWPGLPAELDSVAPQLVVAAQKSAPMECCGVLLARGKEWLWKPMDNLSVHPQHHFSLSAVEVEKYQQKADRLVIFHTHPDGPSCPSAVDMKAAAKSDRPWVILSRADRMPQFCTLGWPHLPPLLQRGYIHGVTDCYRLILDFYARAFQINLPDFPREWGWWEGAEQLYQHYFPQAGFRPLSAQEQPKLGDVFLAQIRSHTPNHGGVYLSQGRILHHLAGQTEHDVMRMPQIEPAERWHKFITLWLRYKLPLPIESATKYIAEMEAVQ